MATEIESKKDRPMRVVRAKKTLSRVALFLGELRDGLTMINMQSAFLIASKNYEEKQVGVLFFVFGMSQFLFQTPAGYLLDYSDKKIMLLSTASIGTTLMTLFTAFFAQDEGKNFGLMVFVKFLQGAITALIPPGLNSITQGIVGASGMTSQVSINEMMNHLGTAIIVLTGSVLSYWLYPKLGLLFVVSPIACAGVIFFLMQIRPNDIDHDAARGLVVESDTINRMESIDSSSVQGGSYKPPTLDGKEKINTAPSFNFGFGSQSVAGGDSGGSSNKADTPLKILRDPALLTFIFIVFCFHTANGTILPLVMQTLAKEGGRSGILWSGMCIIVAQVFMVMSAKICGDYSCKYGRKVLFLIGLFSVPVRCFILDMLLIAKGGDVDVEASFVMKLMILSTQILDGVGAGTFGTMYILVTSDLSGGTGRFSLTLGLTTAAMSIGGTVSGYLGQALAQDIGYREAFVILGFMSLVPALLYLFFMPETLPQYTKEANVEGMKSIDEEEVSENTTSYTGII